MRKVHHIILTTMNHLQITLKGKLAKVGHFTRRTLSMDGNASQHQVLVVPGNATRIPLMSGECKTSAAIPFCVDSSPLQRKYLRACKIDAGHRPNGLPVEDNAIQRDFITRAKRLKSGGNIGIQVFF